MKFFSERFSWFADESSSKSTQTDTWFAGEFMEDFFDDSYDDGTCKIILFLVNRGVRARNYIVDFRFINKVDVSRNFFKAASTSDFVESG